MWIKEGTGKRKSLEAEVGGRRAIKCFKSEASLHERSLSTYCFSEYLL